VLELKQQNENELIELCLCFPLQLPPSPLFITKKTQSVIMHHKLSTTASRLYLAISATRITRIKNHFDTKGGGACKNAKSPNTTPEYPLVISFKPCTTAENLRQPDSDVSEGAGNIRTRAGGFSERKMFSVRYRPVRTKMHKELHDITILQRKRDSHRPRSACVAAHEKCE